MMVFQTLWKGKSDQCEPKIPEGAAKLMSSIVFHDHAPNKTQTQDTFKRLLKQIEQKAAAICKVDGLPHGIPCVMVVDNVSSYFDKDEIMKLADCLYKFLDLNVYVLTGLPNRSHALKSGDQFINKSCRNHIRQRAKLRLVRHCVDIADGRIPPKTPLDMSERAMKPLICLWLSQWLASPELKGWIEFSWQRALSPVPEILLTACHHRQKSFFCQPHSLNCRMSLLPNLRRTPKWKQSEFWRSGNLQHHANAPESLTLALCWRRGH